MSGINSTACDCLCDCTTHCTRCTLSYIMPELLNPDVDMTVVTMENQNMKVITKEGEKIKVMNVTDQLSEGQGIKVGTVYKLENGEIIHVSEGNQTA